MREQGELGVDKANSLASSRGERRDLCVRLDVISLRPGRPADITVIDPDATQVVDKAALWSKSQNTPFGGWELPTRVHRTLFAGRTVYVWDGDRGRVGADAARYRVR